MKILVVAFRRLKAEGRWDIDYHLPPVGIQSFPKGILAPVSRVADVVKTKRDPTKTPDKTFLYIDIASVDVDTGTIMRPQELTGEEAPSRARKVVHAFDLIISTCRPTRGAIAVIPEDLHGQICSTGFSVIRPKPGVNPFYLHFALRLASTLEQFRKWSTGSSYPAILDEDVLKTQIPAPPTQEQDNISKAIRFSAREREKVLHAANAAWQGALGAILEGLEKAQPVRADVDSTDLVFSAEQVMARMRELPPVEEEAVSSDEEILEQSLFEDDEANGAAPE